MFSLCLLLKSSKASFPVHNSDGPPLNMGQRRLSNAPDMVVRVELLDDDAGHSRWAAGEVGEGRFRGNARFESERESHDKISLLRSISAPDEPTL